MSSGSPNYTNIPNIIQILIECTLYIHGVLIETKIKTVAYTRQYYLGIFINIKATDRTKEYNC